MRRAVVVAIVGAVCVGAGAQELELLANAWPRAFMFRHAEGFAARGAEWETWDRSFSPLSGIMGKVMDEEAPGRSACLDYFARFAAAHPEQAVLLHYNGRSRDPRDAPRYFAGHWLYFNGCSLTEALPAEPGEAVLRVEDARLFRTGVGRYGGIKNEDVGVCARGADGRPDWSRSEQLELLATDEDANTITVRRGAFGTEPMAFLAGSYVAAHASEGPWGRRSNLLWLYNLATTCPRDARGRSASDILVEEFRGWFAPGGPLDSFAGMEFDVAMFTYAPRPFGRSIDADADGAGDSGIVDGVNVYGLGQWRFHRALREALGDELLIMADGHNENHQRSVGILNGIESEGWPDLRDWEMVDWAGGINRHLFWRDNAREPKLNYINHKFLAPEDDRTPPPIPFSRHRLVFAAGLLTDSAITCSYLPPAPEDRLVGVWDELCMGAEAQTGWLGAPLGPPIRLAERAPDLLGGAGAEVSADFLARWRGEGCEIAREDGAMRVSGSEVVYEGLRAPAGDLTVFCTLRAEPMAGYPQELPRLVRLGCRGAGELLGPSLGDVGRVDAAGRDLPLETEITGALVRYIPAREIGGEALPACFVHPPYREGASGWTWWERKVAVPEGAPRLSFATGLSEAPNPSDGLTFAVEVRDGETTTRVFEEHHTNFRWVRHQVDLTPWAGRRVTLRFLADAGPEGNSTADHGSWADVWVDGGGPRFERSEYCPAQVMAWANGRPFRAGFYFRDVGPATVDLVLTMEGVEPLYVSDFTVHGAPDAMAREYQHGVVLANPSMHLFTFDLDALFPDGRFRRFHGTALQDLETNSGEPVADTVTLSDRDALFLVRRQA